MNHTICEEAGCLNRNEVGKSTDEAWLARGEVEFNRFKMTWGSALNGYNKQVVEDVWTELWCDWGAWVGRMNYCMDHFFRGCFHNIDEETIKRKLYFLD